MDMFDGEVLTPFGEICIPVTYYKKMKIIDYKIKCALEEMEDDEKKELLQKHIFEILKRRKKEGYLKEFLCNLDSV